MATKWADIQGYEGMYQVSDSGCVRSLDRIVNHSLYGSQPVSGRDMSPTVNAGYYKVTLSRDGVANVLLVSRLVACAFVDGRTIERSTVNHIDGNKLNNDSGNLEWCTQKENVMHAFRTGLASGSRGVLSPSSKLTNFQVRLTRSCLRNKPKIGATMRDIADTFSVSVSTIERISTGASWSHLK